MDKVLYTTLNETNEHLKKIADALEFFKDAMSKEIKLQEERREAEHDADTAISEHRNEQVKFDMFEPQIGQKFRVAKTSEFIYRDNDYNYVGTLVSKDEVFTVMRYSERHLEAGYVLQLMSGTEVWFTEESLRNALKSHALEML